jgi:tetratricopeptide (TPR) repeat protein
VGALVFLASVLAVRGVYQLVPFLMALGCAAVTTFLTLKTWRLIRSRDLSFYRFNLKSAGKIQTAGWAFVSFAILCMGLTAHSGWVRHHEFQGDRAFEKLQIPDELALAQTNPGPWLSPVDRESIADGKAHFRSASNFGLFINSQVLAKLAWFEYLSGDAKQSVGLLEQAAIHQEGQARALSLYYLGTILNRLGDYDAARKNLDQALAERDDLILAREEIGESLWQLGQKEEAISVWSDAVQRNGRLVLANNQLAGATASLGRPSQAIAYERQADQFTPNNPHYHWMIGLRLRNLGMNKLAEKHFQLAIQLDPGFHALRNSLLE